MKQQLNRRLQELKVEFDSGQKILTQLEAKQANTRNTLLRISGAIQVLEELLSEVQAEKQEQEPRNNPHAQQASTG